MKEFIIGLIFLLAVALFVAVGVILCPFLLVLAFFLRVILISAFVIFSIWLLGKLIIYVWERIKKK